MLVFGSGYVPILVRVRVCILAGDVSRKAFAYHASNPKDSNLLPTELKTPTMTHASLTIEGAQPHRSYINALMPT